MGIESDYLHNIASIIYDKGLSDLYMNDCSIGKLSVDINSDTSFNLCNYIGTSFQPFIFRFINTSDSEFNVELTFGIDGTYKFLCKSFGADCILNMTYDSHDFGIVFENEHYHVSGGTSKPYKINFSMPKGEIYFIVQRVGY